MMGEIPLGRRLLHCGWQQGSLFTTSSVDFLFNEPAKKENPQGPHGVRKSKKGEQFVLISQLCDIVADVKDEPYVEALICKTTNNQTFLAHIDRNSARYFVVDLQLGLVAQAKYRLSIKKEDLLGITPRPWPSDEKRRERFVRWLARRYDRPALADEIVDAFQTPVEEALEKFGQESPDLSSKLTKAIYEFRVSLPTNLDPPYHLQLVLMRRDDSLSGPSIKWDALSRAMPEAQASG